jgi:outer membrane protein assembly factor BamB
VYVHFGTYGTACLDSGSGKILWTQTDLHCDHFRGPGSSPILYNGLLYLTFDGYDHQFFVALDKNTGKPVWKKDRSVDYGSIDGDAKKAYGTPALIEVHGRPQLISTSSNATYAYEPATGEELWHVVHGGMNAASPPLSGLGKVFLNTGDGGFRFFALRQGGQGDVTKTHVDWKFSKSAPSRCSPLLIDDLLYVFNEGGIATCLEAKTGREVWRERLAGQFSSSPIYAGGHIYFASQDGPTFVLEPGRTFKLAATNRLDDGCMASPAVAGRAIILRTKTHLYCLEQR